MSTFLKPITRQWLDKDRPNPKLPPRNINAGIDKDLPCSAPACPNFCSPRCGFCETHCDKFHNGIHYRKGLKADIPEGIKNFLDLQRGSTLHWHMDFDANGERIVKVTKQEKEEIDRLIQKYHSMSKEDIELVAQQANVSLELAEKALIENGYDLAKAILSLTTK